MPRVLAVAAHSSHAFSKTVRPSITVVEGLGVSGDAHAGTTVKHRSRVARDPTQPNLRQVHLVHVELFHELREKGHRLKAGDIGENILTEGLDLLGLSAGTRLRLGEAAVVEITGLRNPCSQLDAFQPGLMAASLDRAPDGSLVRKAGVMGIVIASGVVHPGDDIAVLATPDEHRALAPV
jgi:MOSC domain-containing protein YiiM